MLTAAPASSDSRYRVLMELGHGGTADVFLAIASGPAGFNKLVVLKALRQSLASDPTCRRSFLAEARLSARLNHPNIVQVNEVTEQAGIPVIVMEYLEGRPLSQVLWRSGREIPLPLHLRIIADSLAGLHYSHELSDFDGTPLNLVHRDVSPHNVFVTFEGVVKLLDFGIAKLGHVAGDTETGTVKGKVQYMSPEQLRGDRDVDRRADLFAVGVMLWEAATGRRLWQGISDATTMTRILHGEIPDPREAAPDCPPHLAEICRRALAFEPDERHRTALELKQEIEGFLEGSGVRVSGRDVGWFLASQFEAERKEARQAIDDKLVSETSVSKTALEKIAFLPTASVTRPFNTTSRTEVPPAERDRFRRSMWAAVLLAGGLTVPLATWYWTEPGSGAEAASSAAAHGAAAAQSVEAAQQRDPAKASMRLRVTAFPATARLSLDGRALPGNPYDAELDQQKGEHHIRAEAPGHRSATRQVQLTGDVELVIVLERLKPDAGAATEKSKARRPAAVRRSGVAQKKSPTQPAVNCSPPYFFDARGVKRFKPDCL